MDKLNYVIDADKGTAIAEDPNLTKAAIRIFGNIVDKAYITAWTNITITKDDIEERLEAGLFDSMEKEIDNGGEEIVIKFTNGKEVRMYNSEWGSIETNTYRLP